jgi:integrase
VTALVVLGVGLAALAAGGRLTRGCATGYWPATQAAELRAPDGSTLVVTPHQLRHTWATELANAGLLYPRGPDNRTVEQ